MKTCADCGAESLHDLCYNCESLLLAEAEAEADTLANLVDSDWACQELPEDYRF
jgi:hypothetical protein